MRFMMGQEFGAIRQAAVSVISKNTRFSSLYNENYYHLQKTPYAAQRRIDFA